MTAAYLFPRSEASTTTLGQRRSLIRRRSAIWLALIGGSVRFVRPAAAYGHASFFDGRVGPPPSSRAPAFATSPRPRSERENPRRRRGASRERVNQDDDGGVECAADRKPAGKRRKKKNKYADYSEVDGREMDPFEAMVSESEKKIREIEVEVARKRNRRVPLDEEAARRKRREKRERNKLQFPDTKTIDPYDPTTYGYTELGTVVGAHGVHGLLKVSAVTEFAERLCRPGVRHLKAHNRRSPREVRLLEGRRRLGDEYLVKLEGIGDRDAANRLRGSVLYALQKERPSEIGEDEYLISDLVGLDVFLEEDYGEIDDSDSVSDDDDEKDDTGTNIGVSFVGTVGGILLGDDMCATPGLGQDMLEIVLPRGRGGSPSWRDEMVLIPFVPQIVPRVNLNERAVYIAPPPGLLDLTYLKEERGRIKGFLPPAKDD